MIYFRLRVRNAADSADALIITSFPSGTNPYITEPPSGDGQSFDPLTGEVTTGSYTIQVADAVTATNTRVVTSVLADAQARQQMLNRKAFTESSTDGTTWAVLIPGYVTAIRLISAIEYEFAIGQTRRIEQSKEIFRTATTGFTGQTAFIGGPVIGGFAGVPDRGGWRFKVSQVNAGGAGYDAYTQLKLVEGFDPRKRNKGRFTTLSAAIADYTVGIAKQGYEESTRWTGASTPIRGWFPGVTVRVQETNGTLLGYFTPIAAPEENRGPDEIIEKGVASLFIDAASGVNAAGAPVSLSVTVGYQYNVYVYLEEISKDNPLHIEMHPVDILQKLWDDTPEIQYDSTVLAGVKAAIGNDLVLQLRITESPKMGEFIQQVLFGPFGMATRIDTQARHVLFTTRIRDSAAPATTVVLADLRDDSGSVFEIDESEIVNKVTFKMQTFTVWSEGGTTEQPEADGFLSFPQTLSAVYDDTATSLAEREVVYDIPGTIKANNYVERLGTTARNRVDAIAIEIFDRWGRGPIKGELACLSNITAALGSEIILNLPHMPGSDAALSPVSRRGLQRIVQIVSRTELPKGPAFHVIDAGTIAQASVTPTFTIVAGTDARKAVTITLTNAAALIAAGLKARIEIATGTAVPASGSGLLLAILDPNDTTSVSASFDAGTKVWAQMRGEKTDGRPTAFSAFQSVVLTALNPPTTLAASNVTENGVAQRYLTWVAGANATDIGFELKVRLTAETAASDVVIASPDLLPAGSTRFQITALDPAAYTFTLRHRETQPSNGVSTAVTLGDTVTVLSGLTAPTFPVAFTGPGGEFGIEVTATVFPSLVEVQVKEGGGAFVTIDSVESIYGGRTRWSGFAPNDGIVRTLKARHTSLGATASAYTADVTVTPWAPLITPPSHFVGSLYSNGVAVSVLGHTHDAADVVSGQFVMARLASGTPNGLKFIRDDGVLAVPAGGGAAAEGYARSFLLMGG